MNRALLLLSALAGLLLVISADLPWLRADDQPSEVERHFQRLDKDADGRLSPEEVNNPNLFKHLDANGDGFVSLDEAKAYFAAQQGQAAGGEQAPPDRRAQVENTFRRMDKNQDGKLSPEEVNNPETFQRVDTNRDGAITLEEALAAFAGGGAGQPQPGAAPTVGPDVSFTPLTDLGQQQYQGYPGGLYPEGGNTPPAAYLQQGLAAAQTVQPLNPAGQPDPNGRLVLLSIGMSNATQEFSVFKNLADADPVKNPRLTIVDGAQGGQTSTLIKNPAAPFWANVDQRLAAAGVTGAQVQVVWLKEAIAGPTKPFPADAQQLRDDLKAILQILPERYPNLKIVYVSSRIYAGYASTRLNPEPYAYQSGFAVKWLIEERIQAETPRPWVAWGPYLWTDGTRGRADGLIWTPEDVGPDGTHPSPSGRQKVANLLLQFFKTDPTAKGWFAPEQP